MLASDAYVACKVCFRAPKNKYFNSKAQALKREAEICCNWVRIPIGQELVQCWKHILVNQLYSYSLDEDQAPVKSHRHHCERVLERHYG